MKVVCYSSKNIEKSLLAESNAGKHKITFIADSLSEGTSKYAEGKDAILVFSGDVVSENIMKKLSESGVQLIVTRSKGTDHIHLSAAKKLNIAVKNIQQYSNASVSEFTIALILSLSRKIIQSTNQTKRHDFTQDNLMGSELHGKVAGIIGCGWIGKKVANILHAFGMKIYYFDPKVALPNSVFTRCDSLDDLLSVSDVVSLHLPLSAKTIHMIGEAQLSMMKPTALLINSSRGGLVDINAVIHALKKNKLGGYAADVFESENRFFFQAHLGLDKIPKSWQTLERMDNVLLTPHIAYFTQEALKQISDETINILSVFESSFGERTTKIITNKNTISLKSLNK